MSDETPSHHRPLPAWKMGGTHNLTAHSPNVMEKQRLYSDPFEAMAPLHRPEFDALVDVVKVLRDDFRMEHKTIVPKVDNLRRQVNTVTSNQNTFIDKMEAQLNDSEVRLEQTRKHLVTSFDATVDEFENIKEDLHSNGNRVEELFNWRAAANSEAVDLNSRISALELQFGLQKQMVHNLRSDYAEDHESILRMQRSISRLELNQDTLLSEIKKCKDVSESAQKQIKGAFLEVKSHCNQMLSASDVNLRKQLNERMSNNSNNYGKEIDILATKINELMSQQTANEGAISSVVEASSVFQDNLASIVSEYTILNRRQAETMSRVDKLDSDEREVRHMVKGLQGSVLASRESAIRNIERSCSSLELRLKDSLTQYIKARTLAQKTNDPPITTQN